MDFLPHRLSLLRVMQAVEQTPQLNVSELYTRRQSRDAARLKAYNKILEIIYHRIRNISQMAGAPTSLLYTIPPFILGLPRIDLEDCVVYLVYQLRTNGFEVRYTFPNLLNINWSHHEKSYILEQSPIMLAMLESDEKRKQEEERKAIFSKRLLGRGRGAGPPKAKSGGVAAGRKKVEFRNQVIMRDPDAPTVGKIPSAADYIPPASFMRQMTEPPKTTMGGISANSDPANAFADLWK